MDIKTTTLGVIGTVGRDKSRPLTKNHFDFMVDVLSQHIDNLYKNHKIEKDTITLYSGGAAWSDHSAVDYFLKNPTKCKLILYLPCFIVETQLPNGEKVYRYEENSEKGAANPGRTSNGYHSVFSKQIGRDTILDIIKAKELGATIDNSAFGYKNRDLCISKADHLVAFTGAVGDAPLGGGTLFTWKNSKSKFKHHVTLPESFSKIK